MVYKDFCPKRYRLELEFQKIYIIFIFNFTDDKMTIRSRENSVGAWAFLIGVILAIIIGLSTTLLPIPFLIAYSGQIYAILVILGIIVGFMNIGAKDSQSFMIAGVILVGVSKFGMESVTGSLIGIGV